MQNNDVTRLQISSTNGPIAREFKAYAVRHGVKPHLVFEEAFLLLLANKGETDNGAADTLKRLQQQLGIQIEA